jgi:nucleoside-diphosphate-sugar epimerase
MKRVLITGANGFLGKNLVIHFLNKNYKILGISRNSNNLKNVLNKIEFIQAKENQYDSISSDIIRFQPDIVIHAGWDGGNNYKDTNTLDQFKSNIPTGISLLNIIKQLNKPPTFVGVGSFAEYGMLTSKARESQIERPLNFYGLSKYTFKEISRLFCQYNNIHWKWVRPCYIYGPGDIHTRVIPSTINNLIKKNPIKLDKCNVTLDYLYIDDFCNAVQAIVENNTNGVYNICSGKEYRLKDILIFLNKQIDKNNKISYNDISRKLAPQYVCGSNTKLKKTTAWKPKIDLKTGLIKTIQSTHE